MPGFDFDVITKQPPRRSRPLQPAETGQDVADAGQKGASAQNVPGSLIDLSQDGNPVSWNGA